MSPEIEIDDNFYVLYSFVHDFGYTKQDEIQSIIDILKDNEIDPNKENVTKALEHIRDILLLINKEYSEELNQYTTFRLNHKIVSGDVPFPISIAKKIFYGIISVGEKIINTFRGKDEDEKMIDKIIENFEKDHENIVIDIRKTYRVTKKDKSDI